MAYGNPSETAATSWLGSPEVPQWHGSPVIMGLNGTHMVCASEARRESATRSCLDEADEWRNSFCLPRSSEIPNPRSVLCSDGCRCSTQDHEWSWLLLLHDIRDKDRLSRLSALSKDIFKKHF